MPPRDLPGLYWDESRERYFPISSRPAPVMLRAGSSQVGHATAPSGSRVLPHIQQIILNGLMAERPHKRRRLGYPAVSIFQPRSSLTYAERHRSMHDIMTRNIASLSEGRVVSYGDHKFASLNAMAEPDGSYTVSTGDTGGWLQTYKTDQHGISHGFVRELYLGSTVTAICRSPTRRLAISLGPSSRIASEDLATDADLWTIMGMPESCYDVRTAHLLGNSFALGAARKGILFPNISRSWQYYFLPTGSDVFSITQHGDLIHAGTRSGSIITFDKRTSHQGKGQEILGGRYLMNLKTITHLSVLNEWQLLVSTISGDLDVHDLRFGRNTEPIMQLHGHCNAYMADLGIAVSPCNSYVFAAGQDGYIRAWSLHTGERLVPPPSEDTTYSDEYSELFHHYFAHHVVAMQVTDGGSNSGTGGGLSLWALAGKKIYRYWLGQRLQDYSMGTTIY